MPWAVQLFDLIAHLLLEQPADRSCVHKYKPREQLQHMLSSRLDEVELAISAEKTKNPSK